MAIYERAVGRRATGAGEPVAPRPLALAPLVTAALFGWLGIRAANPWLQLLACACGSPLVVAWLTRPRLHTLAVRWVAPYRCVVGETVAHRFEVVNVGSRPTPPARMTHRTAGFAEVSVFIPALAPGGGAATTVNRQAQARTVTRHHRVVVLTAAPLGLIEHRRSWLLDSPFVIHPAPAAPVAGLVGGGDGEAPSGAPARTGTQLHAGREWRPGDDRRHVHWRSTARHGRLVVIEPERTVARRLAVVVGGSARSADWEPMLARAAWTVVAALREGREVRLVADDHPAPDGVPSVSTAPDGVASHGTAPDGVASHGTAPDGVAALGGELVTSDPISALDWFAALTDPAMPSDETVEGAVAWAGPGADVVIAATEPDHRAGLPRWDGVRVLALAAPAAAQTGVDP